VFLLYFLNFWNGERIGGGMGLVKLLTQFFPTSSRSQVHPFLTSIFDSALMDKVSQ
jgi:hypothetical protein